MMVAMNIGDLRNTDLNLLVVFHLLMQERNVTRAATKLHLSQSAVSAALARLRGILADPLFERGKSGMEPTARAIELAGPVALALGHLARTLHPEEQFSPTESARTFHIAMSDDIEAVVAPWLLQQSIAGNWQVKFAFHQTNSRRYEQALANERVDLVLCATPPELASQYRSRPLFSGSYLCVFSAAQRGSTAPISTAEFRDAVHLRVSFDAQRGFIDELLESAGIQRRVPLSISHFAGIPSVLHANPAIVTLPDYTARALAASTGLATSPMPLAVPSFTTSMVWRVGAGANGDHSWLLDTLDGFQLPGGAERDTR